MVEASMRNPMMSPVIFGIGKRSASSLCNWSAFSFTPTAAVAGIAAQIMHITSPYSLSLVIQLGTFAGQKFLLEQEVGSSKVIVDAPNQQSPAAGQHVHHLPTFQAMLFQGGDIVPFTEQIIAHQRPGW